MDVFFFCMWICFVNVFCFVCEFTASRQHCNCTCVRGFTLFQVFIPFWRHCIVSHHDWFCVLFFYFLKALMVVMKLAIAVLLAVTYNNSFGSVSGDALRDIALLGVTWLILTWCDSFMYVTSLIHMCNMTHSHVRHDSFIMCDMTDSYVCKGNVTQSIAADRSDVKDMDESCPCETWRIHVWHDSFMCATWLIHVRRSPWRRPCKCDMTHSYVWHDSFIYVIWLIRMWHDSFMWDVVHARVTWLIHMRNDSFMYDLTHSCKTWLIQVWHDSSICAMTHSDVVYVWRDSFMCVM